MNMEIDFRSHLVSTDRVCAERTSHRIRTPGNGLFQPPIAAPDPRLANAEDPADESRSESRERFPGGGPGNDSKRDWSPRASSRECSKPTIATGYPESDQRSAPFPIGSCRGSLGGRSRLRHWRPAARLAQ